MNSRKLSECSQLALFSIMAAFSPSKFSTCAICFWKQEALCCISSVVIMRRMSVLPEGSPMYAVPPPSSTIGLWPARCICAMVISAT